MDMKQTSQLLNKLCGLEESSSLKWIEHLQKQNKECKYLGLRSILPMQKDKEYAGKKARDIQRNGKLQS
jgi:hypothetical protein